MNNVGIVLCHYEPQKSKISLLDKCHGKIEARPHFDRKPKFYEKICAGSIISYQLTQSGQFFGVIIDQFVGMPFNLAKKDIHFLHHLLELCQFFIPVGSQECSNIFDLIQSLYYYGDEHCIQVQMQKLILFRFFAVLGIYPEHQLFHSPMFYHVLTCSLSEIFQYKLSIEIERMLDVWLSNCVNMHPMVSSFKTGSFLDEVRLS